MILGQPYHGQDSVNGQHSPGHEQTQNEIGGHEPRSEYEQYDPSHEQPHDEPTNPTAFQVTQWDFDSHQIEFSLETTIDASYVVQQANEITDTTLWFEVLRFEAAAPTTGISVAFDPTQNQFFRIREILTQSE